MNAKSSKPTLTREELDYIRELFSASEGSASAPAGLHLATSEESHRFLEHLRDAGKLRLEADWGNHRLLFPVDISLLTESGELNLELGIPEILESGAVSRNWRVTPDAQEIRIDDTSGLLHAPRIVNISASGLAIRDRLPPHAHPEQHPVTPLLVRLPGLRRPLRLKGRVVRSTRGRNGRETELGIHFEHPSGRAREALDRYIFHRHRELYHHDD